MRGTEYSIPENRAQTITTIRITVMMQKMASLHALKPSVLEIEEVRCKMHEVINHVSEDESGKETRC